MIPQALRSAGFGALLLALAAPLAAQSTTDAARAEGKAFGRDRAAAAQAAATTAPDARRVPNFGGTPSASSSYFDDPERMSREAASQASSHAGYEAMRSSIDRRARFARVDLDATIARAKLIGTDPLAYTSGMGVGGTEGRCVPLPPGSGSGARYKATCNVGYAVESARQSCQVTLQASVHMVSDYRYDCPRGDPDCAGLTLAGCTLTGTHPGRCLQGYRDGNRFVCTEPGEPIAEYTCPAAISGLTPLSVTTRQIVDTARDESPCAALAADTNCTAPTETCTDSDPVTRIIGGASVTQPCWAWRRDYLCNCLTPAQDCSALAATPGCTLEREYCLTDEQPCRTTERVYDCPVPEGQASANQFICDGDVYCIDGSCETIRREANDEFKDAAVALNALAQARREFDPDSLTLFRGTRNSCASKVFGVLNCCRGKGFPLIPGIQLLVALGCSREEMLLHQRDAQGLCAYVGTYCASSVLGVCLTKRKVYCCFESKLARILQEQGRKQLGKPWGNPKTEQCLGFTIDEFARLDLSQMDFSEVYAEFTDAARLPDELQAVTDIQQKIEDYYARARH
ncbi:conjugal transfer protein TraN [Novosphingobium piscinae]|uniref:Conjugal transfer protein TraN n=1 Tax=Novosphingobium piscinae TaxID=1507448 RepID=A0A7X1FWN1_9SPHN|nr:conjugal transfer protein TraN [Novosphingobium piscinae]MBC2668229.1 conjugal transfer protein TraN [Novosphingobium piscinae]